MTDGDDQSENETSRIIADLMDGENADAEASGFSKGDHGTVTGDEDIDFNLESCEIVAQSLDTETSVGTRLYYVSDDIYALAQYRRSVSNDWSENFLTHGILTVNPIELDADTLRNEIADHGTDSLTDEQLDRVRDEYVMACRDAIWAGIDKPGTNNGPVLRGRIVCIEDHSWRETLRPRFGAFLSDAQLEAVEIALMDSRPDVDWTWCQLYAIYVARLDFAPANDEVNN